MTTGNLLETNTVPLDIPIWMNEVLASEARRIGITAGDLLKIWVAQRIKIEGLQP